MMYYAPYKRAYEFLLGGMRLKAIAVIIKRHFMLYYLEFIVLSCMYLYLHYKYGFNQC